MNRFPSPHFTDDAVDLMCPNVDCPGLKGEKIAVRFVGIFNPRTERHDECPYCGKEGRPVDPRRPLLEQLLEPDRRRVAAEELAARAGVEDEA